MEQTKAPGLKWRRRANGPPAAYWHAPRRAVAAGYAPKVVRLHEASADARVARCARLQKEANDFLRAAPKSSEFDGTVGSLIALYLTDPDSSYRKLKPNCVRPYDVYAGKIVDHIGDRRIAKIDSRDMARYFRVWGSANADGDIAHLGAARFALSVFKAALKFGKGCRLPGCADLQSIISDMRFEALRPRTVAPTAEEIVRVRAAAHAAGHPERALAYALQFETTLRQWDVIGQWVPISDRRPSLFARAGKKWIGPTWARIDEHLVLRLTPSKTEDTTEARVAFPLAELPMVMDEFEHFAPDQRSGPLILNCTTGLPYTHTTWREAWRADAGAAELPDTMWNRDIRAGGITEGGMSKADRDDRAKTAGHSDPKITTEVYDRGVLEAARRVAQARVAHRQNGGRT